MRDIHFAPILLGAASLAALGAGCDSSKTETGYSPRRLGMSDTAIRAIYAPAFSPEAQAALQSEKKPDSSVRRP